MVKLDKLLEYEHEKKVLEEHIKLEKKFEHMNFVEMNKTFFRVTDILVVLIILMNFGAVCITNYLVTERQEETGKETAFYEVNPIIAKRENLEVHPNYAKIIGGLFRQSMYWLVLILVYVSHRMRTYTEEGKFILVAVITIYFIALGFDFFNDFGFLLGVL